MNIQGAADEANSGMVGSNRIDWVSADCHSKPLSTVVLRSLPLSQNVFAVASAFLTTLQCAIIQLTVTYRSFYSRAKRPMYTTNAQTADMRTLVCP